MDENTMQMNPPPPAVVKLLRRSTTDRVFGGVCGGLGRYWNVDPVILRIVFGVSLLAGGLGIFLYLAMWWLVPDDRAPADARVNPSWWMVALGGFAALIAAMIALGLLFTDSGGGVVLGALLAGVIIWIVLGQRSSTPTPEPTAPAEPGYAYGGVGEYTTTQVYGPPAPVTPRERSYLGLMGLSAAIAATGIAMLLSQDAVVVMATGLLVLAVTMLIGAFRGKARWLLIIAVPWLLLLAVVAQVQQLDINAGDSRWSPTPTDTTHTLTAGRVTVDFSQWQGQPTALSVDMGIGETVIDVPRNWDLLLVTDFGVPGSVEVNAANGFTKRVDSTARTLVPASGQSEATLRMDVSTQVGGIVVNTDAPAVATADVTAPIAPTDDAPQKPTTQKSKEKSA